MIERINSGPHGLIGPIWTDDLPRGTPIAATSTVSSGWVDPHGAFNPLFPFPLIRLSGMGVDWADHGVKGGHAAASDQREQSLSIAARGRRAPRRD